LPLTVCPYIAIYKTDTLFYPSQGTCAAAALAGDANAASVAKQTAGEMIAAGVPHNRATRHALIAALGRAGRWREALGEYTQMRQVVGIFCISQIPSLFAHTRLTLFFFPKVIQGAEAHDKGTSPHLPNLGLPVLTIVQSNYCLLHTSQLDCLPIHGNCTLNTDTFRLQNSKAHLASEQFAEFGNPGRETYGVVFDALLSVGGAEAAIAAVALEPGGGEFFIRGPRAACARAVFRDGVEAGVFDDPKVRPCAFPKSGGTLFYL
jgi:hypothetical protein